MPSFINSLLDRVSCDLAIDLGSSNTLIYRKGRGIIVDEPSVISFDDASPGQATSFHVGAAAKERQSADGPLVKPVKFGIVADFAAARAMLSAFLDRIRSGWYPIRLRVIANIPAEATDADKRSIRNVIRSAGVQEVYFLEEPRALALGAGLDLSEDHGNMVLDIGGGITEMAVIVGGNVIHTRTIRMGGEHMDQAIVDYLREKRNLLIDVQTAEAVKIRIGEALPGLAERRSVIDGVDVSTGMRVQAEVTSGEVREALSKPLRILVDTIRAFLQKLSPDQYVDVLDRGIMLAGGGTLLCGIDRLFEREILMPFIKSKDPLACLVLGTGGALDYMREFRNER